METKIYQIDLEKDENGVAFESYNTIDRWQGTKEINKSIYELVYSDNNEYEDLENIYLKYNLDRPDDYNGRSLSVSDIIVITGNNDLNGTYYVDSIGFKKLDINMVDSVMKPKVWRAIICAPNKKAEIRDIARSTESLQSIVGGYFEVFYPYEDDIVIICNEEGKINGSKPNRIVYDETGNIIDIIYGTMIILGNGEEELEDIPDNLEEKYFKMFRNPGKFCC